MGEGPQSQAALSIPDEGYKPDPYEPSVSSSSEEEEFSDIIASIAVTEVQTLALQTFRAVYPALNSDVPCKVDDKPLVGAFNIVYVISFGNGTRWVVRLPAEGDVFSDKHARRMHHDLVAQRFIAENTSIPLPKIHRWSTDANNVLKRPFAIMDYVPGTNLSKVWNDPGWISEEKRDRIFEQLAQWSTELSKLEFLYIGSLDIDPNSGEHIVVPLASCDPSSEFNWDTVSARYSSTHSFLSALLSYRRSLGDSPMLALLQLFALSLPDPALDGPPFVLSHPDLDSQNVLVDDNGTITGIIDWDGIQVGPMQGGAAAYPSWLTVDWDPLFYGWVTDADPEVNAAFDSPTELIQYRKRYLAAVDRASAGTLTYITRNSHIFSSVYIAIVNPIATSGIVDRLSQFVFGSGVLGYEVEEGIKSSSWFAYHKKSDEIAELTALDERDGTN